MLWLDVENKGCTLHSQSVIVLALVLPSVTNTISVAVRVTRIWTRNTNLYKPRSIQSKSPPFPVSIVSIERHHDGGDVQRCLGMQLSGSKANTSNRALTILTSQIIPCLPPSTVDPRLYQFELLEFYPGCSLSGVACLSGKRWESSLWSVWGHIFICHQPELSHE